MECAIPCEPEELFARHLASGDRTCVLEFAGYEPQRERSRETVCTLANGYLGVRRAAEEAAKGDPHHYPGTYLAGGFNRAESQIAGHRFAQAQLVNWPNWLVLQIRPRDGNWLSPDTDTVLRY